MIQKNSTHRTFYIIASAVALFFAIVLLFVLDTTTPDQTALSDEKKREAAAIPDAIDNFYEYITATPGGVTPSDGYRRIDSHPSYQKVISPLLGILENHPTGPDRNALLIAFFEANIDTELPFFMEFFHSMHDINGSGRADRFAILMTEDAKGNPFIETGLWDTTELFLGVWAKRNGYAAMSYLVDSKHDTDLILSMESVLGPWTEEQPVEAIDFAETLVPNEEGSTLEKQFMWSISEHLLVNDQDLFLSWTQTLEETKNTYLIEQVLTTAASRVTSENVKTVSTLFGQYETQIPTHQHLAAVSGKLAETDPTYGLVWALNRQDRETRELATTFAFQRLASIAPYQGLKVARNLPWSDFTQTAEKGTSATNLRDQHFGNFIYSVIDRNASDRNLLTDMLVASSNIEDAVMKKRIQDKIQNSVDRYFPDGL